MAFLPIPLPLTGRTRLLAATRRSAHTSRFVCSAAARPSSTDATSAYKTATTIPPNATDDEFAAALMPLYVADRERFMRAVMRVKQLNRHTRPLFPPGVDVASVPRVPAAEAEAFCAQYINAEYLAWDSEAAAARMEGNGRPLQYRRWRWACENVDTFVNMLREYGHPDDAIARMFEGVPLCFATRAAYDELRAGLKVLAGELAEEMGWANVGFVVTGSSVPGFSQNPLKGFADQPSKITDPDESDVDICIVADGINVTVAERRAEGGEMSEPRRGYPTTSGENTCGMRFGCGDLAQFSKATAAFHAKWAEKLAGGLQLTFCEDDTDIPPWEARIDIGSM